jgi:hypothetical protein
METKRRQCMYVVTPHSPRRMPWPHSAVCVATQDNTTMTFNKVEELRKWTSREAAHSLPLKGLKHILPATCRLIRYSRHLILGVSLAL